MSKIKLIICFIFFAAISVSAQNKIKLWDEQNATKKEKWSELTVFLPEKQNDSGVSVIVCPGGSYFWLDSKNEGSNVAQYLNKQGITAFVLKYRTAMQNNRHPAMIDDLERAMQIVKANSQEYGIDPEKIGIMGFSAGGHLAGTAAIYFDSRFAICDMRHETKDMRENQSQVQNPKSQVPKPYFAAMIYPVVSMEDSICHKKSRKNLLGKDHSPELAKKMSLEQNVRPDMPPVFLLHCTGDKTVDYRNCVVLAKALTEKGVKHKFMLLDEYGKGGHGFGIQPNGKATGWIDEFLKWLKEF